MSQIDAGPPQLFMNAVASALAAGGCHTTCEISIAVGFERKKVAFACSRLVSRGWATRKERGCFEMTAEGREAHSAGETLKPGPNGPLTQERPRRPLRSTTLDKIWRAIRIQRKFTIGSITEVTGASVDNAGKVIRTLCRAGYLVELSPEPGFALTSNGFKRWSLIDDTGFLAPSFVKRDGESRVYDRNAGALRAWR